MKCGCHSIGLEESEPGRYSFRALRLNGNGIVIRVT